MTGTAISLIDPSALTGDDAMAFNFLTRAANAILAIPSLVQTNESISDELRWIREERDVLRATNEDQAQRISLLEAQLAETRDSEARWRDDFTEMRDLRDARQRDIDVLDDKVAKLESWRESETARADGFRRDYEQTFDAYTLASTKLEKMQRILGALTEDEVEEVPSSDNDPNLPVQEYPGAVTDPHETSGPWSNDHSVVRTSGFEEAEPEATRPEYDYAGERIDYDRSDKLEQIAFHD